MTGPRDDDGAEPAASPSPSPSAQAPRTPAPTTPPPTPTTPPAAPLARQPSATTQPPSPDVAEVSSESVLPGAHRGGFSRLPTAPVEITTQSAPAEPESEPIDIRWAMPTPEAPRRGVGGWALLFSILGLVVSLFVGWGFPLGIAGIVAGIMALRRPLESRAVAVWAIALGALSILYSAGWLLFAAVASGLI
ncbi:hypothetical protein ACH3VR_17070 [Microbacterium sp. B2969]|uniref:DUF4190 domain-containing protein n=1 Tax=Microbacterium alkaliflavum TaxID=3248839 RepID=A0ABW7QB44_9MICO